jgi:hypothetical protein
VKYCRTTYEKALDYIFVQSSVILDLDGVKEVSDGVAGINPKLG